MRHVLAGVMALALVGGALASDFCGGNGTVKLSFTPGPEATRVSTADAGEVVEVYAILDDVELVDGPGGVVLALGGFECELRIVGTQPLTVGKTLLLPGQDFGRRPTQVWAGLVSEHARLDRGPLTLIRWTLYFEEKPENVRFELDPEGLLSCSTMKGCPEANVAALYNGSPDARQEGYLFAAGFAPAVLNPTAEPDLAEQPCAVGFADVGIFSSR